MTSPPIPPNFSHRIWTIHRNDLIEQWGGQFPPSPPRGAATDPKLECYGTDREGAIKDAFLAGIISPSVRQRLLESDNLTFVFDKARSQEETQRNAEQITGACSSFTPISSNAAAINATASKTTKEQCLTIDEENLAAVLKKCYF